MSSLENAFLILNLLDQERPVLRVGEVCRETGLPKSSVSRLLKAMSEHGILAREEGDMGYVLGRRVLELGELYLSRYSLLDELDKALDRLIAEYGFAGFAGVLSEGDFVVLKLKYGSYPLRFTTPVGDKMPAFESATGRALLSRLGEDEAVRIARTSAAQSRRAIADELETAREYGVAVTTGSVPGVSAVGAAVQRSDTKQAVGFCLSFPIAATDDALQLKMANSIRHEARRLGRDVGDPYWRANGDRALQLKDWKRIARAISERS